MPTIQPAAATVVLAAHHFNPSITSQSWLLRSNVFAESDLRKGCMYTDAFVNVNTDSFNLLITPDQVQVTLGTDEVSATGAIEAISRIANALPHTPYTGVGLNFFWHLVPDIHSTRELSRCLFFHPDSHLYNEFDTPDARFGAYFSKDWRNSRIKLDIKPMRVECHDPPDLKLDILQFGFNFHRDLQAIQTDSERSNVIDLQLSLWEEAKTESLRIVTSEAERGLDDTVT